MDGLRILPGVEEAVERLKVHGFTIVLITNQPDVPRGITSRDAVERMNAEIRRRMPIDDVRVCYHTDEDDCRCRKPKPGMIVDAARALDIDLGASWMVGDRWKDTHAGQAAGCRTILVDHGYVQDRPPNADKVVQSLAEAATHILSPQVANES